MMRIKGPGVAGRFYPKDPAALATLCESLLRDAPVAPEAAPKALILPHAGMAYSGAVAATGVAAVPPGVERVVILAPSHHLQFDGIALPDAEALSTPLGTLPIDESAPLLSQLHDINVIPEAYAEEHAIEVELPLLQTQLGTFSVLPLLVGRMEEDRLADILEAVWGGVETLVVISTDLSHFLTGAGASARDGETAIRVERADPNGLTADDACGHRPLAAFLRVAAEKGLTLSRRALTHSGRVTGDATRVVGYGCWIALPQGQPMLPDLLRTEALTIARKSLISRSRNGKIPAVDLRTFNVTLCGQGASFVSLTLHGKLRGCIGSLQAHRPLIEDIVTNSAQAGFDDRRFRPIMLDEIHHAQIEISLLSRSSPMRFTSEADLRDQLVPGRDGLVLSDGKHRGTLLPKVWDAASTPNQFLTALKRKAGLAPDHWSDTLQISRYRTETFAEDPS